MPMPMPMKPSWWPVGEKSIVTCFDTNFTKIGKFYQIFPFIKSMDEKKKLSTFMA